MSDSDSTHSTSSTNATNAPTGRPSAGALIALAVIGTLFLGATFGHSFRPMYGDERSTVANIVHMANLKTVIPAHFNYPTFFSYVSTIGFAGYAVPVHVGLGRPRGEIAMRLFWPFQGGVEPTAAFLFCRFFGIAVAGAALAMTFALGRRMGGDWVGVAATAAVAFSYTFLGRAILFLPDCFVTLLATTVVWLSVGNYRRDQGAGAALRFLPRRHLLAAALVGLTIASKYNGALVMLSVLTAWLLPRLEAPRMELVRGVAVLGTTAVAFFLVACPGWLLATGEFWEAFQYERQHMAEGQLYVDLGEYPFAWIPMRFLGVEGGLGLLLLAGLGFGVTRRDREVWILLLPILASVLLIGSWKYATLHYLLWCFPSLATLAALGLARLADGGGLARRIAPAAILLACVVPRLPAAMADASRWMREDSNRLVAERWIESNIPDGARVDLDWFGMRTLWTPRIKERFLGQLRPGYSAELREWVERKPTYRGYLGFQPDPPSVQMIADGRPQWVVTNSDLRPPTPEPLPGYGSQELIEGHENMAAFYAFVETGGDYRLEREFSDGPGAVIRVYRRRDDGSDTAL